MTLLKKILPSIIILFSAIALADVNYEVTYVPQQNKLEIQVEHQGDGITKLELLDNAEKAENIKLFGDAVFLDQENNKIGYDPTKPLRVKYDIIDPVQDKYPYNNIAFIRDYGFHTPDSIFLFPKESEEDTTKINITFNVPEGYKFATNATFKKISDNKYLVTTDKHNILRDIFIACSSKVAKYNSIEILNKPLELIFCNIPEAEQKGYTAKIKTIYKTQLELFSAENNVDYSFVSFFPGTEPYHFGVHLNNNAILYSDPNLHVLSHEHVHHWLNNQSSRYRWFMEGFSDYYAHKSLLRAKMINLDDYLKNYNFALTEYYQDAESAMKSIDCGCDAQFQYQRGNILAQELDERIKIATRGTKSLDNIMKKIFKDKQEFTTSYFQKIIAEIADINLDSIIESIGENGKLDGVLSSCIMDCKAKLYMKEHKITDYGFDIKESLKDGEIIGLDKNSNAYKAGLRLWQEFVREDTPKAELKKEGVRTVNIVVKDHTNTEKTITYTTEEKTVLIPQYKY